MKVTKIPPNSPHHLTVGELKNLIKDMDDSAHVFYERIEDNYFNEDCGWTIVAKRDYGLALKDEDYDPDDILLHNQFVEVFSSIKYKDDPNLYLTAHY